MEKTFWLINVFFITLITGLTAQNINKEQSSEQLSLWYEQPAKAWMTEALPIGNGPLGAMLFGGTEIERIQFNEISLWSGDRMPIKDDLTEEDMGAHQAFGDIYIRLGHDFNKVTNYKRSLDLNTAIHLVEYDYMGVHYVQKAFASHPGNVIVVQLTADKPMAFTGDVWLTDMHDGKITLDEKNKRFYSVGDMKNGFEYESQLQVFTSGEKLKMKRSNQQSSGMEPVPFLGLNFIKSDSVTLILSAGTNFKQDFKSEWLGEHPHAKVTENVDAASLKGVDALLVEHLADYQNLFGRVSFDLGKTDSSLREKSTLKRLQAYKMDNSFDPELEALFAQYGRYLLISCSRPGSLPANLQGNWNNSNLPVWAGDYHSNINLEMNYWPAETANLGECHVPFIDYVSSLREVSALNTRKHYGDVRGWTIQTMNNATGLSFWKWNAPGSAWYAQHLWEHYAFGRDKDYLRNTAYPILKEICHFWEDHLVRRADGTLVTPDGWSPEQYKYEPEEGVTYDQEIIYDLFTNTIEAAEVLGGDEAFKKKLIGMREDLLKPAIGRWGQLKEWEIDKDDPEDHHRHVSHLFALYPGRQISVAKTPELAEAAKVSLNARGDESTGWSRAWKINFWARLGDGNRSYKLLRNLINLVDETKTIYGNSGAGVYSNLLDSHPPFQIDGNLGATAGYCEMLMQSHADEIQLLPALPSAWPEGSVKGLRARGGFEIDITWKEGKLTDVVIYSESGLPCKVTYNGKVWESKTKAGKSYTLNQSLKR
ncbi:glycoside hydrolase N-terminal domain-containing protein [Formosa undariae]|uniref:Glycoside hydrolase N-terminal domain-containing protein n=1 Tax=Formosa undariae TaxID=1325436 RepID=A0ABV5F5V8_9FLAO